MPVAVADRAYHRLLEFDGKPRFASLHGAVAGRFQSCCSVRSLALIERKPNKRDAEGLGSRGAAQSERAKSISIQHHSVRVGEK